MSFFSTTLKATAAAALIFGAATTASVAQAQPIIQSAA